MKKAIYYSVISISAVLLYSCWKSDDAPQFLQTTVKGKAVDQLRNVVYSNETITLAAVYTCGTGFNSGVCYEFIASTVTNTNGEYEFTFDYDMEKGYTVNRSSQFTYYETEEVLPIIQPGEINTIDFVGWRPVILKVEASVTNNIFPDLHVLSRDDMDDIGRYNFPYILIPEETINTTVYLHGKPKTQMSIIFDYSDNNSEANYHGLRKIVNTGIQDTIPLSYEVNCSNF